jgi:hypothetical protein
MAMKGEREYWDKNVLQCDVAWSGVKPRVMASGLGRGRPYRSLSEGT